MSAANKSSAAQVSTARRKAMSALRTSALTCARHRPRAAITRFVCRKFILTLASAERATSATRSRAVAVDCPAIPTTTVLRQSSAMWITSAEYRALHTATATKTSAARMPNAFRSVRQTPTALKTTDALAGSVYRVSKANASQTWNVTTTWVVERISADLTTASTSAKVFSAVETPSAKFTIIHRFANVCPDSRVTQLMTSTAAKRLNALTIRTVRTLRSAPNTCVSTRAVSPVSAETMPCAVQNSTRLCVAVLKVSKGIHWLDVLPSTTALKPFATGLPSVRTRSTDTTASVLPKRVSAHHMESPDVADLTSARMATLTVRPMLFASPTYLAIFYVKIHAKDPTLAVQMPCAEWRTARAFARVPKASLVIRTTIGEVAFEFRPSVPQTENASSE